MSRVCQAAQALKTLAKEGIYSRTEITAATMSLRAEYIMFNKEPFVVEAISALNATLNRIQKHQQKFFRLRAL